MQIPLDALDALADPRLDPGSREFFEFAGSQPPPFRLLSDMRSSSEFGAPDLATIGGIPTLAVAKGSETVVFKQLMGKGIITTMNCAREETHSSYVSSSDITGVNTQESADRFITYAISAFYLIKEKSL